MAKVHPGSTVDLVSENQPTPRRAVSRNTSFASGQQGNVISENPNPAKRRASRPNSASGSKLSQDGELLAKFLKFHNGLRNEDGESVEFDLLRSLIGHCGVDINVAFEDNKNTLLHIVADRNLSLDYAKFIIKSCNGEVNIKNKYGATPLHLAAANAKDTDLIDLLIENGATVDARTEKNLTPLHFAARFDKAMACQALIEKGAKTEARDRRMRTPLFVAAEFCCSRAAGLLVKKGADVMSQDSKSQSCLAYMVELMPSVALTALDTLYKTNEENRRQEFHLDKLILSEPDTREGSAKSLLQVIVDYEQVEIVRHPVIHRLIQVKWESYGRKAAVKESLLYILYALIWTVLGIATPWQTRYKYSLPSADIWRIFFWIFAIAATSYLVYSEIKQIIQSRKRFKEWKNFKLELMESEKDFPCKLWTKGKKHRVQEIEELDEMLPPYLKDFWNLLDWLLYFLNVCVFIIHVADASVTPEARPAPCCTSSGCESAAELIRIGNETDTTVCGLPGSSVNMDSLSVWVNRFFAINVVLMWLGLLKYLRAFRVLGPLVVALVEIINDVGGFVLLYLSFYIPYFFAFWMIFGLNSTIESMKTVDRILFSLFRMTLVDEYQYDDMHAYDFVMTYIFVGSFLFITAILWINLFIALLSDTFHRVYSNAKAVSRLQKAIVILAIEENRTNTEKEAFHRYIAKRCSPKKEYSIKSALFDSDEQSELEKAAARIESMVKEIKAENEDTMRVLQCRLRKMERSLSKLRKFRDEITERITENAYTDDAEHQGLAGIMKNSAAGQSDPMNGRIAVTTRSTGEEEDPEIVERQGFVDS